MKNYFALLDIAPSFTLDEAELQRLYLRLQHQYHPDRQAGKTSEDRQRAIQTSMDINQAYATLKDPLRRAQHLLELGGVNVNGEHDTVKPDSRLLMEMMELRESLEESASYSQLGELYERMETERENALERLAEMFARQDMESAAQLAIKLNYVEKFLHDVKIKMQQEFSGKEKEREYDSAANT